MAVDPFIMIIFGPPGSGKSTQADLVAEDFGAVHFNTGHVLRQILHDPKNADDPKIQEELEKNKRGELNDTYWVCDMIMKEVAKLHGEGKSVVFSGSPRTQYEAEQEILLFKQLYGSRIFFFVINIDEVMAKSRNVNRRVCSVCHTVFPLMPERPETLCEKCGGELVMRKDDDADVIERRLAIYREQISPVRAYIESQGIPAIEVDGTPPPAKVYQTIRERILS